MPASYPPSHNQIGIDEVGIGCLAGPFTVAAVVLPKGYENDQIRDSKKLTPIRIAGLARLVIDAAEFVKVFHIGVNIINANGVWASWDSAVREAAFEARVRTGFDKWVFVDGVREAPIYKMACKKKGDQTDLTIAAASIVAKYTRDEYMRSRRVAGRFPVYDFASNVGYGTPKHINALIKHGSCKHHRTAAVNTLLRNQRKKEARGKAK